MTVAARDRVRRAVARSPADFSPGQRLALRPPTRFTVTEHAARHVHLGPGNAEPGPLRPERTPHARWPADCFADAETTTIVLMFPAQTAKSQIILNAIAYAANQDPGPTLLAQPRKEDAEGFLKHRIKPLFEHSPTLSALATGRATDWMRSEITLRNGMVLYTGWGGSAASLAGKPIRYFFGDEIDKWPAFAGKEADPVKLGIARTRTFKMDRKIVLASTPTVESGRINREFSASTQYVFAALCPKCLKHHVPSFERVQFDDSLDPKEIRMDPRGAVYVCPHCQGEWDDGMRMRAMNGGQWALKPVADSPDWDLNPSVIDPAAPPESPKKGFHCEGVVSPWITSSEIAAEFLEVKDDPPLLMEFTNQWRAKTFKRRTKSRRVDSITALRAPYERGTVPKGVAFLTAGADIHKERGLYYTIRGWGYGRTSWLIDCGVVYDLEVLCNVLFRRTFPGQRENMGVRLTFLDANWDSDKAYDLCRAWPERAMPSKGKRALIGRPLRKSKVDESLQQVLIDTTFFKDLLDGLMSKDPTELGRFNLFRDAPLEYCQHLCAETKEIVRGSSGQMQEVWRPRDGGGRWDWWDSEVYAAAAAEMLGVFALPDEEQEPGDELEAAYAGERDSWLGNLGLGRGQKWL